MIPAAILIWAALGTGGIGFLMGAVCMLAIRKTRVRIGQATTEMEILFRQCQTEYRDGFADVRQSIASLESQGQQMEDALRGRFTNSLRSKAAQLMRSGHTPEKAAAELGVPRNEMRLLARVSRILQNQN